MKYENDKSRFPLSDEVAIQSIIESEAKILKCMAKYFCFDNGVMSTLDAAETPSEKLELLKPILAAYTDKENSIACVLQAAAKKLAVDKNILPCELTCSKDK